MDMSHAMCKLFKNKVKYCSNTNLHLHVTRHQANQQLTVSVTTKMLDIYFGESLTTSHEEIVLLPNGTFLQSLLQISLPKE